MRSCAPTPRGFSGVGIKKNAKISKYQKRTVKTPNVFGK